MNIAFTLCSNNYLAQAKTLGDSLKQYNPGYHFVIGLVDKLNNEIDYNFIGPYEIVEIESIGIPGFQALVEKYNIIELNTAVKPFLFAYLLERYLECNMTMYFDPDILVFSRFDYIEQKLAENSILLTPHIWSPIGVDDLSHGETLFLRYGIYNLGFIGVSRTDESLAFLNWWKDRTYHLGFNDAEQGMFVDQKWINLAPLFFKSVYIAEHLGLNVAFWNLHERHIEQRDNRFVINGTVELVFFHFSQFNPNKNVLASNHNRYTFENRRDTVPLFSLYRDLLLTNRYNFFRPVTCYYTTIFKSISHNKFIKNVRGQESRLKFSWLFKFISRYVSISKALTMKMYMDYLINVKRLRKEKADK